MARRDRNSIRRERLIMLASSVFVLTALTLTGVYVNKNNKTEQEDYVVDFEALEGQNTQTAENMMSGEELDTLFAEVGTDDLDYDPSFQEANSQKVENTEEEKKKDKSSEDEKSEEKDQDVSIQRQKRQKPFPQRYSRHWILAKRMDWCGRL